MSFIKPVHYDYRKSKRFKAKVGRQENMRYDEIEDCYYCADNRKLSLSREVSSVTREGYVKTPAYYRCQSCEGCLAKESCFQSKRNDTKLLKVKRDLIALKEQSLTNITSPEGIKLRINRSIQVEGAFGVIKHHRQFKRFLTRGKRGITTVLYLLDVSYNMNKLYAKRRTERLHTHLFDKMIA